jgi:uncharacterized membrane protein YtjA (UPF0391 family)
MLNFSYLRHSNPGGHALCKTKVMREHLPLWTDVITFLIIALVAYPFAFLGVSGEVANVGKIVCAVSVVCAALSFAVKRPPSV